ncbi:hypothetical protein ACHAWC_011219, partial [Mediolabrus comicus]
MSSLSPLASPAAFNVKSTPLMKDLPSSAGTSALTSKLKEIFIIGITKFLSTSPATAGTASQPNSNSSAEEPAPLFRQAPHLQDSLTGKHLSLSSSAFPSRDKRLLSDAENAVVLIAIFDSGALENENFTFNMNSPFFFLSYETDKFEPYEHTIQLMQRHRNPPHPVLPSVGHADHQIPPPAEPKRPTQPTMNPPPPPTPPQQPTQQPADTEEFTIEDLSLNDVGEELEPSESQEELFAKAASPAPASPKRKTHDDDTDTLPSSTKRRSTEDTDVTMDNPDDTSRPFHELAKGNLESWELLFHNNLNKHFSHPDLRAILKFFSDITTPLSHQGRTPDGYFPLVIEVAPITTYT